MFEGIISGPKGSAIIQVLLNLGPKNHFVNFYF